MVVCCVFNVVIMLTYVRAQKAEESHSEHIYDEINRKRISLFLPFLKSKD